MSSPDPSPSRLAVRTFHCRFCNHLLIASTRELHRLSRRKEPAKDAAVILPLPPPRSEDDAADDDDDDDDEEEENGTRNEESTTPVGDRPVKEPTHSTLLLSTALPDRKPTLVRRDDGIEKRLFLRCGRCRVAIGYFLDSVHFPAPAKDERAKAVYLLPGALMETDAMGDDEKMKGLDREWDSWA